MRSIPNYLTTLSNGDVQAIFSGGIQMLAGSTDTPPDSRQIRWVRENDGALVAKIQTWDVPPAGNPPYAYIDSLWQAFNTYDGTFARFEMFHSFLNDRWSLRANANGDQVVIWGEGGSSGFVQIFEGGPPRARIVRGTSSPFVNGVETNTTAAAHNLGVVPVWVNVEPRYGAGDNGRWSTFINYDSPPDGTNFAWFARDAAGSAAHGPGNLNAFKWMVLGIG